MESFIGEKLVDAATSKLSDIISEVITDVLKNTWYFKSLLTDIKETMKNIKEKRDPRKPESSKFTDLIKEAEELIRECEQMKSINLWKRYRHAKKLDELNKSLSAFVEQFPKKTSSGWSFGVPLPKEDVIGFEGRVNDLKRMVLKESIVVVSAAGGFGKTTLVTLLCHDREIKERFGRIYFVTISRTPDLKAIVARLLQKNHQGQLNFNSDEDAIHQWGSFLNENISEEILLVLDDVWSDSIVKNFKFKSPGYRILVTSRTNFTQFKTYELQPLKDQHATKLFRSSSLSENESEKNDERYDLIDKLVKCCKNHPLVLSVIGGSLKGKPVKQWQTLFRELSKRKHEVLDQHDPIFISLEKTLHQLDQPNIKKCFMDLGLFPEDQKIAATALMDMWVHLYKHDEEGSATQDILWELSYRNLATLLPVRQHVHTVAYHCEEKSVMHHDLMRTLSIQLGSKETIELRERLIINPGEPELPQIPETVNARLLSISTDERNYSMWNNIQVPKVEVFVCNFLTKTHPLPQFMHRMDNLKVLIITNYGYRFSELENFPSAQYLSSLTTIRLDHISISSIITSILELKNLQKLSLIMCKIGDTFNERTFVNRNKLSSLLDLDIDSCDDLVTFPIMLCHLVHLKKLCITNCHYLTSLPEEFGNLTNLEVLRLASCSNLITLPRSFKNLKKLRILDISDCLSLKKLPVEIGELGCLRTIHMRGCMGLDELPSSVEILSPLEVVCDKEISLLWSNHPDVKLLEVEEDKLGTLMKIIAA